MATDNVNSPLMVKSLRRGLNIGNPRFLFSVEFCDGTKTVEYGTNRHPDDHVSIIECMVGAERGVALPGIRDYCRELRAVLALTDTKTSQVSAFSYPG